MGYPFDLEEHSEAALIEELDRRRIRRERGLCDYCARPPQSKPCKFPERHQPPPPPPEKE